MTGFPFRILHLLERGIDGISALFQLFSINKPRCEVVFLFCSGSRLESVFAFCVA